MNAVTLLSNQIKSSHNDLRYIMSDVTDEMAHWRPSGNAHPIGSRYVHAVFSADAFIPGLFSGAPPLFAGEWAGKTGASEPHPLLTEQGWTPVNESGEPQPIEGDVLHGWAHSVTVDLEATKAYAEAVYSACLETLSAMSADDLEKTVDLSSIGLGVMSTAAVISLAGVTHIHDVIGEIAAVKGLQGAQGFAV